MTRSTRGTGGGAAAQTTTQRQERSREAEMASDTAPLAPGVLTTILDAMSERTFQGSHVVDGLRNRGFIVWVVPDMKKTAAGLPDVLAWHPLRPGVLLCWELKRTTGRASVWQRQALEHLSTVVGVDARIVRPRDWGALRDVIDNADPAHLIDMLTAIPRGF